MKTQYLLPFAWLLLLSVNAFSQKQKNVWCFGDGVELNFDSIPPVNSACAIATNEGCSSISDTNGHLLFYTDGITVYNRNNDTMPGNTIPLGGNSSTTQSALIVPMPGSTHEYYVFCTDAEAGFFDQYGYAGDSGTQYSIIDMNLNGGLGDVAQQPTRLVTPTCEKISATPMANQDGYWVVVHLFNSNSFYTYPVTCAGVGAPVISNAGVVTREPIDSGINAEAIGYMRISPDGTKLAMAIDYELHIIQVFNFDNATGAITGPIFSDTSEIGNSLFIGYTAGPYGLCFSPGGQFLYFTVDGVKAVYQYNLLAGNDSAILASVKMVGSLTSQPGALQTGPDQKIYVDLLYSIYPGYLDRINSPDSAGVKCNYEKDAIVLTQGAAEFGLPEFPTAFITGPHNATITTGETAFCAQDSTQLCAPPGYTAYQWNNGLTGTGNCVYAKQAGNYKVQLTDSNGCTVQSNQLSISVYPAPSVPVIVDSNMLSSYGAVTYQWLLNNEPIDSATGPVYIVQQQGLYSLQVSDSNGCTATSNPVEITPVSTGVQSLVEESVSLYPNPSVSSWQLAVGNELVGSALEIYDEQGRLVMKSEVRSQKSELTANTWAKGVYYLRISNENVSVVRKLVKL